MKKIAVIGAGASGLVAAIFAARQGNDVILLEKNNICGKKLLATGNGRCNFWNEDQSLVHYRSSNFDKIKNILNDTNREKILEFFKSIGIEAKIKNGYYYPFSNQASSMQKALILEAEKEKIQINTNQEVTDIKKINDKFEIYCKDRDKIISDRVILATGSKASPKTGSTGFGYEICKKMNHSIVKPLPALVQLRGAEPFFKEWKGIRADVSITLYENNQKIVQEKGEIQLTDYGISGICVFNLSGRVARGLEKKKQERVEINFLEGLDIKTQDEFLVWVNHRDKILKNRTIAELLEGVLNDKLVKILLKRAKISGQLKWKELEESKRENLAKNIIAFSFSITGTNSFEQAQICSGGIPLDEISSQTMESKKVAGLYLIGELLDVDGDCGGYNLEWAWVTGMIAGTN